MTATHSLEPAAGWSSLDERGFVVLPSLFDASACGSLAALYDEPERFRSRIAMSRHGFGRGEYQYFAYPLPPVIGALRREVYAALVSIANRWNERMAMESLFPATHEEFIERCHGAGQRRPTPLLLRYAEGDFNCLHQDLYGEHVFPLQMAVLLSRPGEDFSGGEFVLTEQRPRQQSRVEVVPLEQGDAVVFAVNERPVRGARGDYRVKTRHGVSRLRSGRRLTLGVILHDAT